MPHPGPAGLRVDIHDIDPALLACAARGGIIVTTICGTARDGSPACATVPTLRRELVER
nr:DUF5990 family protein [Sphingobium sp. PAMC28499]